MWSHTYNTYNTYETSKYLLQNLKFWQQHHGCSVHFPDAELCTNCASWSVVAFVRIQKTGSTSVGMLIEQIVGKANELRCSSHVTRMCGLPPMHLVAASATHMTLSTWKSLLR